MNKINKNNKFMASRSLKTDRFERYDKKGKEAFTFAELMVSLVIIAIITALLYPTIAEISPNNNKQLFKSAYKTVELIVEDIITASPSGEIPTTGTATQNLCNEFKNRLNSVKFDHGGTQDGCGSTPYLLQTSNGMRWYFQNYTDPDFTIYVDVNAANNGGSYASMACDDCTTAAVEDPAGTDAPNSVWATGCFRSKNPTVRDTFKIKINKNGKVDMNGDTVGSRHLRDEDS